MNYWYFEKQINFLKFRHFGIEDLLSIDLYIFYAIVRDHLCVLTMLAQNMIQAEGHTFLKKKVY